MSRSLSRRVSFTVGIQERNLSIARRNESHLYRDLDYSTRRPRQAETNNAASENVSELWFFYHVPNLESLVFL